MPNVLRISGWRTRELARGDGCPLQPLDGQARSVRAINDYTVRINQKAQTVIFCINRIKAHPPGCAHHGRSCSALWCDS